jgi:hypothetical protein
MMTRLNLSILILGLTLLSSCDNIDLRKQKSWSKIEISENRSRSGDLKSYRTPSNLTLQDFIKDFGQPIDSVDYSIKFKNDVIEYEGLLAPNVKSMKEYESYVKLIEPIRKRLEKKYTYEAEAYVYRLKKAYYKKMAQYEFKYKESRQDRLTRIKQMMPDWDIVYIDNMKYRDLYDYNNEYALSEDLKHQNCIRYEFALAEKVTKESVYGTYSNDTDAEKSINTFGYIIVDADGKVRIIDGYYRFDDNVDGAVEKKYKRNFILFGIGFLGLIILSRIRAKRRFKKLQAQELLFLEEILNDARNMDIINAKNKYYLKLKKYLLVNTGSEAKYAEIEIRIKYTVDCTKCRQPNFVQSTIKLIDTDTESYMTNGRYNKDGSLDKRYNTEYSFETTYTYSAHCDYCKKDFQFERDDQI